MAGKKIKRKYLQELEQAIKDAEKAYVEAVIKLQESCEHRVILEHVDRDWEMFRVCEGCGATCRAPWSSPAQAYGNLAIFEGRAYKVDWTEFASNAPKILGWCQKSDEPTRFQRGGSKS